MKKNSMINLVIVIGVGLIFIALGLRIYSKNKEVELINKFSERINIENNLKADAIENTEKDVTESTIEDITEDTIKSTTEDNIKDTTESTTENIVEDKKTKIGEEIAIIEISSIELKSIIVEGTEKEQLRHYLGHFENTVMPGKIGNFSIAGHSSAIYNEILNNLHKVNIGDEIKLKTVDEEFEYVITKKFIVEPTEISVLDQDKNIKSMTIVTCAEHGKKRLIVKAEMKS